MVAKLIIWVGTLSYAVLRIDRADEDIVYAGGNIGIQTKMVSEQADLAQESNRLPYAVRCG